MTWHHKFNPSDVIREMSNQHKTIQGYKRKESESVVCIFAGSLELAYWLLRGGGT